MSTLDTWQVRRIAGIPLLPAAIALAGASILSAFFFQHVLGYQPCKLCFIQRWPYYIGLPVGLAAYASGGFRTATGRILTWLFILTFLVSIGLGAYHSGVEWGFWPGPTDCTGSLDAGPASVLDLKKSLATAKVVRCDQPALRILGLSFAGWNVVVSAMIAWLSALSLKRG